MVRWRAPGAKKSPYITPEGYASLQTEQQALWSRRNEVTVALAAAAAEGDRSENAEYIYRKKELREIDRRIRYLQKRIPDLHVVGEKATDRTRVYFGCWVTIEDDEGREVVYRIVGPDELDPGRGWISMDSPMAQALMRKTIDDEVSVVTPAGIDRYWVIAVSYDMPPGGVDAA